jgi:hypothetical protein
VVVSEAELKAAVSKAIETNSAVITERKVHFFRFVLISVFVYFISLFSRFLKIVGRYGNCHERCQFKFRICRWKFKQIVQQGLFLMCSLAVNDFKFGFKFFSAKQKNNRSKNWKRSLVPNKMTKKLITIFYL